jgi:CHASE2 domain-containing sensor protein
LEAAGVRSPVRTALVLLFLALAPTAAVAGLLRGFDPFARLIIAFTTTIVILVLTSIIMLMAGVWSPTGELLAIVGITTACLVLQLPSVGRRSGEVAAEPGRQQP